MNVHDRVNMKKMHLQKNRRWQPETVKNGEPVGRSADWVLCKGQKVSLEQWFYSDDRAGGETEEADRAPASNELNSAAAEMIQIRFSSTAMAAPVKRKPPSEIQVASSEASPFRRPFFNKQMPCPQWTNDDQGKARSAALWVTHSWPDSLIRVPYNLFTRLLFDWARGSSYRSLCRAREIFF